MVMQTQPEIKTIRGIVIPTDWHDDGHARSVAIATYHEQKYVVAENAACRRLLPFVNERVVVSGVVREEGAGMVIEIGDFHLDTS